MAAVTRGCRKSPCPGGVWWLVTNDDYDTLCVTDAHRHCESKWSAHSHLSDKRSGLRFAVELSKMHSNRKKSVIWFLRDNNGCKLIGILDLPTQCTKHTCSCGQQCTLTELLGTPFLSPDGQSCLPAENCAPPKEETHAGLTYLKYLNTSWRSSKPNIVYEMGVCCTHKHCCFGLPLKCESVNQRVTTIKRLINRYHWYDRSSFSGSCFWPERQQIWGDLPAAGGGQKEDQADPRRV